jgi:hypothetical protein
MIDVNHQINAVRRAVGTRVLEAGEARVVTVSQSYSDRRRRPVGRVYQHRTHTAVVPADFRRFEGGRLLPAGGPRQERSSRATRRRISPPPGSPAATSAGSTSASVAMAPTGRNWWLNTSLTWTTRTGASSGRVLWGWAGIPCCSGWPSIWAPAKPSTRRSDSVGLLPRTVVAFWRCPVRSGTPRTSPAGRTPQRRVC